MVSTLAKAPVPEATLLVSSPVTEPAPGTQLISSLQWNNLIDIIDGISVDKIVGAAIADNAITNAKAADVATSTIKGRVTAATGNPEDLTGTQATTLLDVFTSVLKGLSPASGGGTTNFLRADGTWNVPPGGSGETNTASNVGAGVGIFDQKVAADLEFNSIIGGTGIDATDTTQDITIAIDGTVAVHSEDLSVFAATSSLQLKGVINDETGSGALVFGTSPSLVTPALGTPASGVMTNMTNLPVSGLANGTDGELITWDSGGVATTVPVGTATHVLTSNGVGAEPTFQAAAGGTNTNAWILNIEDTALDSTVEFGAIVGRLGLSGSEGARQNVIPFACTIKKIIVDVRTNSGNTNAVPFTLRLNAGDTALVATATLNTTGKFSDTADVSISADDNLSMEVDNSGNGGTLTIESWTVEYTVP